MRAVPFGLWARNEREGGGRSEPGVFCFGCGAVASLRVVRHGLYHCTGVCEEAPPPLRPRRRQPRRVWTP